MRAGCFFLNTLILEKLKTETGSIDWFTWLCGYMMMPQCHSYTATCSDTRVILGVPHWLLNRFEHLLSKSPEHLSHHTNVLHSWASSCDPQIHSWFQCVTEMGRNELFLPLPLICQADSWQTCCYLVLCWTVAATDYHIFLKDLRRLDSGNVLLYT